jgi:hypothetical protein
MSHRSDDFTKLAKPTTLGATLVTAMLAVIVMYVGFAQ